MGCARVGMAKWIAAPLLKSGKVGRKLLEVIFFKESGATQLALKTIWFGSLLEKPLVR